MSHPVEESAVLSVVKRHPIQSGALCFLPALFLSFLWRSDSQTLIHVTVEQPENVASGEEAWGGKTLTYSSYYYYYYYA